MTADLQATFRRWARALDPDPETVKRIGDRLMERIAIAPSKQSMLERYRDACAGLAGLTDSASDEFIFSAAYRDQARRAAISAGATLAELRQAERGAR